MTDSVAGKMSFLDRYLTVWIFVAMGLGIVLGHFVIHDPAAFFAPMTFGSTNLPIAIGLVHVSLRFRRSFEEGKPAA
jgi:ACR3 family arsenite transporter